MTKILVVAPHADDEVLGCGGLIAKRAAAGAWVHVAVMGLGGVTPRGCEHMTLVAERRQELELAAQRLGVSRTTVLYPGMDMRLDMVPMVDMVTVLDRLLDEVEYEEVYLPEPSVNHDHQITYRAMLAALRPITGRALPERVATYEYAMTGWQLETAPGGRLYVDIRKEMDTKLLALREYQSQVRPSPHPCSEEAVLALAMFRGMEAGLPWAEMFRVLREIEP